MNELVERLAKAIALKMSGKKHGLDHINNVKLIRSDPQYAAIARAVLSEISAAGYELRPIGRDLTPEEMESIVGISGIMRGAKP